MEATRVSQFRHRKILPSDLLLGVSTSHISTTSAAEPIGEELNEEDIIWASDFAVEPLNTNQRHQQSSSSTSTHRSPLSKAFSRSDGFGILAALPEDEPPHTLLPHPLFHHKPPIPSSFSSSTTTSRMIPAIPRPPSIPAKLHQSAPVNVPMFSRVVRRHRGFDDIDDDGEGDGEMLPPHEMVARSYAAAPILSCSVLEGVGRTLKGRDLRQVRNAVWRSTGFLD